MCELISRQAAIDAVYERIRQIGYEHSPHVLSIRQAIRDLPSAQQWIPCSERLPDNDEPVLISNSHGVTKAWWNGRFWTSIAVKKYKTVTAWMPLPEPYKGET